MSVATWLAALLLAQTPPAADVPLAAVAGAARYRLSASSDLLLQGLDPDSSAVFAERLMVDRERPLGLLWTQLAAGALQVRRESGGSADTLWFNPALDAGLLVRWTRVGGGWRAVAVAPFLGETLRGEAARDVATPPWAQTDGDLARSLDEAARRSFAAAARVDWNPLFDAGAREELAVLARLAHARDALGDADLAPGYAGIAARLRRLLIVDDPGAAGLPDAVRSGLARLGSTARQSLRPVGALRRPDGWTVIVQSPDAPAIAWLVHFADPRAGQWAAVAAIAAVQLNDGEVR